ncbi:MAG: TolC family protein [Prolixibacteraceae bacterium]|nr:TolC family protein [Prolixibacteraceae bacterium]
MKRLCILVLLVFPVLGMAQPVLTLKNAIDTTLSNSFDIRIAGNNVEISKINNSFGVAGGLPTVNASLADNQSVTNVNQKLNSGTEIKKSSASGNTMNSSVTAGMVLFNGFKVFSTKERLSLLQKQSELLFNLQIQNSIASVMAKYYDIVRQKEYLKIMQTSLDVSQKKLDIVTERKNVGMANDADYLQALIDLNSAQQQLRSQQLVVDQTKMDLLQLMSKKKYYPYLVDDSITVDHSIQLNSILNFLELNPQYLAAEQQIKINEQLVKEVSALRYPSLRVNTGYNLNRSESDAGLTLLNQNYGPYAGLTMQIPIYNGNAYKIQKDVAQYNLNNARLQQENLLNLLTADAVKIYQSYSTTLQQLESQLKTIEFSRKLIYVVMQRFQVNQATILDVKAAQSSFELTGYQLINLKFAAKISEIELKRLMYQLGN